MTDIVERIRSRPNDLPLETERLLEDAGDEIEKLRGILNALDVVLQQQQWGIRRTLGKLP